MARGRGVVIWEGVGVNNRAGYTGSEREKVGDGSSEITGDDIKALRSRKRGATYTLRPKTKPCSYLIFELYLVKNLISRR